MTSANSVKAVATAICGKELLLPPVACVGAATADEARKHLLIEPAFVSQRATGKELANGLPIVDGARILLPQSSLASDDVARILTQRGARIDCVTAYITLPIGDGGHVCEAVCNGEVDVVIVTSPSTLNAFLDAMRAGGVDDAALGRLAFAPIGPTTASCLEAKLLQSLPVSTEHSLEGMLDCIASYFDRLEAPKRAK